MDYRFNRRLKITSIIMLFFFLWTFELSGIAYAITISQQTISAPKNTETTIEKRTGKHIEDVDNILKSTVDIDIKRDKIRAKRNEIDADYIDIKKVFVDIEKTLKNKGLPPEIIERHRNFVITYDGNHSEFQSNLDAIDRAMTTEEIATALDKTKAHLDKVKARSKHKYLDPNNLPIKNYEEKEVILEQWRSPTKPAIPPDLIEKADIQTHKSILVASNGSLKGIVNKDNQAFAEDYMRLALITPEKRASVSDADLAESSEVQFTSAIQAKAAELGHNPHRIYEWVRNNIDYVPTYGSIQGADMCLQTKQCNDTDTASLLIALLRTSGIHARYAYGVIELPIDEVMNWVGGFTDPMAALNFIASAGIPVKGMTEGGQVKYVQMEHVWVEAWIDYIPSRGVLHRTGQGDTWVALDGSYKQYSYTPGIDIKSEVPFDAHSFSDQIKSSATINEAEGYVSNVSSSFIQQTMIDYHTRIQSYISETHPNATVGDVLGKKEIIKQEFPYLLGTLNQRIISKSWSKSVLPDNLRYKVSFNVTSDNVYYDSQPLNITKIFPEIAGKKITLSYAPATGADEAVISSYMPKPHSDGSPIQQNEFPNSLPAYLIQLKPELRIDGVVVATGGAIGMGEIEDFTITITPPSDSSVQVVNNKVTVGEYNAVSIAVARTASGQLEAITANLETTKTKLDAQDITGLSKDDIIGDTLYSTLLSYFCALDTLDYVFANSTRVLAVRLPSVGRFFNGLNVDYLFGVPVTACAGAFSIDVGLVSYIVQAPDGSRNKQLQFMMTSGLSSSALEHSIPEKMLSTSTNVAHGISAVKALRLAAEQGIPIYTIAQSNINTILPQLQLSTDTLVDIQNAVNSGKIVTVSKTNISFNDWIGCGYIVSDNNTGAGAYMISGGLAGGDIILPKLSIFQLFFISCLFTSIGAFAGYGIAMSTAIASLVVSLYDLISTILPLYGNANLTQAQKELFANVLTFLFICNAVCAFFGIFFGSTVSYIAIAIAMSVIAIFACMCIDRIIEIISLIQSNLRRRKKQCVA